MMAPPRHALVEKDEENGCKGLRSFGRKGLLGDEKLTEGAWSGEGEAEKGWMMSSEWKPPSVPLRLQTTAQPVD